MGVFVLVVYYEKQVENSKAKALKEKAFVEHVQEIPHRNSIGQIVGRSWAIIYTASKEIGMEIWC